MEERLKLARRAPELISALYAAGYDGSVITGIEHLGPGVVVTFQATATPEQRAAAQAVASAFIWDDPVGTKERQLAWTTYRQSAAQRRLDFLRGFEGFSKGRLAAEYAGGAMQLGFDNLALSSSSDISGAVAELMALGAK